MTHRSTIVTRVHTEEGIVGEAYAGDEDAGLLEIDAIIRAEIAPLLLGEDALAVERCWELARPATFDILRDRRLGLVACACVDAAIWDAVGKALGQPLWRLWGGYRRRAADDRDRRLLRQAAIVEAEVAALRERGLGGHEVQGRRPRSRTPTPSASARRATAGGDDFILAVDANQGWTPRGGDSLRAPRGGPRPVLVRGAVPLAQRPARDARRPLRRPACRSARARASSRPAAAAT